MTKRKIIICLAVIAPICVIAYLLYENNHIEIQKYSLNNCIKGSVKIIQISDLHNRVYGENNKPIIDKVKVKKPDYIVITGDMLDNSSDDISSMIRLCKDFSKITKTLYVTGNHDDPINNPMSEEFQNKIKESGIIVLNHNRVVFENISFIGLDDNLLTDNKTIKMNIEALLEECPSDQYKVLLVHEPQYFDTYCETGVNLVLTGHTHGGFFRIPFTRFGLWAPGQGFFPKYTKGEYDKKNTKMIISSGLGSSIIPIRGNNKPEIVEIDIR